MAIEDLNSKAELFRAVRENLESEPLPTSAIDGLQQGLQGGNWVTPTLLNGWANFGGGHPSASYRTEPGGTVRLRGALKKESGAASTTIFTLPAGARPKEKQSFPAVTDGVVERVDVEADGDVVFLGAASTVLFLSLSVVAFVVGS